MDLTSLSPELGGLLSLAKGLAMATILTLCGFSGLAVRLFLLYLRSRRRVHRGSR